MEIVKSFILLAILSYCRTHGQATVIDEPEDVTVCEGEGIMFTCVLYTTDSSIKADDLRWYRLIKDANTTEMIYPKSSNIRFNTSHDHNNTLTTNLTITNTIKSYTGYYWVGVSSEGVCNVSLTVTTCTNTNATFCIIPTATASTNFVTAVDPGTIAATIIVSTQSSTTTTTTTTTTTITNAISTSAIISASDAMMSSSTVTSNIMTTISGDADTTSMITNTSMVSSTSSRNADTTTSFIITSNIIATTSSVPPTSTTNSTDKTMANETGDSSNIYIIAGVIIGLIIVLLILIIMICCFMKRKGKFSKKNEYCDLTGTGTLDKNTPMSPISRIENEYEKPPKLKAEICHQTSTTVEGHYTMIDTGNNVDFSANLPSKEKEDTKNQQPVEYAVVDKSKKTKKSDDKEKEDTQPVEYAVVDKSKKTKKKNDKQEKEKEDTKNHQPVEYAVVDKSKKTKKKDDKQEKLQDDDPQEGTNDAPVVTAPTSDDGTNQTTHDPALHYAVLDTLPPPTGVYVGKDNAVTSYAIVA